MAARMSNSKHNSKPVALFFQILVHCAKTLNFKTTALLTICWNWKKWLTFSKISFFKIFFQFSLPTYLCILWCDASKYTYIWFYLFRCRIKLQVYFLSRSESRFYCKVCFYQLTEYHFVSVGAIISMSNALSLYVCCVGIFKTRKNILWILIEKWFEMCKIIAIFKLLYNDYLS